MLTRAFLWCLLALFFPATLLTGEEVQRIAFASCFKESKKAAALETIADWQPDVFIWMGDNIYGDSEDMAVLREKYQLVRARPFYQKIRQSSTVIGTWDDHDYGSNDAGKEFPMKAESQQAFLDFLDEPQESPRRQQEGVYALHDFGPTGQQVRVILLDTRYHRDAIGSDGDLLGAAQWQWLEKALQESPAAVNLLVSSIQVLPSEHRFEKWANFPKERARLLALLADPKVPPVVVLSGDRHLAEISLDNASCGYQLYELTSSSLNHSFGGNPKEKNSLRLGENYGGKNLGTLEFEWGTKAVTMKASIWTEKGDVERSVNIYFKSLKGNQAKE